MSELVVKWESSDVVWMERHRGNVVRDDYDHQIAGSYPYVELSVDGERYEIPRGGLDLVEGDEVFVQRIYHRDGSLWIRIDRSDKPA